MFEAVELGRKHSKKEFEAAQSDLRVRLLDAQRRLLDAGVPVILIIGGVEGAGKSEVVNRFCEWLDTRGLEVHTFWDETDEETQRPWWWRFWRKLPARGNIGIFFGSWYTRPIVGRVQEKTDADRFERSMHRITRFEDTLVRDGALIIKLWFHISKKALAKRIKHSDQGKNGKRKRKRGPSVWRLPPQAKEFAKDYDRFLEISETALRITDSGLAAWHLLEAEDRNYRDISAGRVVLEAIEHRLETPPGDARPLATLGTPEPPPPVTSVDQPTILDRVDLLSTIAKDDYRWRLAELQSRLHELTWECWNKRRSTICVFEGWDASGKGGAIRRFTAAMDPRIYRAISIAAPTDEERAHHYLWRFWRHVPRNGYVRIFDRSWYGRVLVERVEGFASRNEWMSAYQEINDFEEQLCQHGMFVAKFWIHIDADEQLRRFKMREETPHKLHKITDEDWRNRERWEDYTQAVNEMVARTSTLHAPWSLVPGNDKRVARIFILETLVAGLKKQLAEGK